MPDTRQALLSFVDAFQQRRYGDCLKIAEEALVLTDLFGLAGTLYYLTLVVQCRLGLRNAAQDLVNRSSSFFESHGLVMHRPFVDLIFGAADPSDLVPLAPIAPDIVRIQYFAGTACQAAGRAKEAIVHYLWCGHFTGLCLEHQLAELDAGSLAEETQLEPGTAADALGRLGLPARASSYQEVHGSFVNLSEELLALTQAGRHEDAIRLGESLLGTLPGLLGAGSSLEGVLWNRLALAFLKQGNRQRASECYGATLELMRRNLGELHPDTLLVKANLAGLFLEAEDAQGARGVLDSMDSLDSNLGKQHPLAIKLAWLKGRLLQLEGDFDGAGRSLRDALARAKNSPAGPANLIDDIRLRLAHLAMRREGLFGAGVHDLLALSLSGMKQSEGSPIGPIRKHLVAHLVFLTDGNFSDATRELHAAYEHQQALLGNSEVFAAMSSEHQAAVVKLGLELLMGMVALHGIAGDHVEAQRAEEVSPEPPAVIEDDLAAENQQLLGEAVGLIRADRHHDAIEVLLAVMRVCDLGFSSEVERGQACSLLGECYLKTAQVREAERALSESLSFRLQRFGANSPEAGRGHYQLARVQVLKLNFASAMRHLEAAFRAFEGIEGSEIEQVAVLVELGQLYLRSGRPELGLKALQGAHRLLSKVSSGEHPAFLTIFQFGAEASLSLGRLREARTMLTQAYSLGDRIRCDPRELFVCRIHESKLCYLEGQFELAEELASKCIQDLEQLRSSVRSLESPMLSTIALARAARGKFAEALEALFKASLAYEALFFSMIISGSEYHRLGLTRHLRLELHLALALALGQEMDSKVLERVYEMLLRRKGLATAIQHLMRVEIERRGDPALRQQAREIASAKVLLSELYFSGRNSDEPDLQDLERNVALLEEQVSGQIPLTSIDLLRRGISSSSIASAIPRGTVLMDFFRYHRCEFGSEDLGEDRYCVFVRGRKSLVLLDLGLAEELDRRIRDFRLAIVERRPKEFGKLGRELVECLVGPLAQAAGSRRRWLIVGDGEIALLPWDALPRDRGRYLVDSYEISHLSHATDLLRGGSVDSAGVGRPLVVGDPDFDLRSAGHSGGKPRPYRFGPLPGTRMEAKWVAAKLQADLLLGADALERTVKERVSPAVLHIATHGFFLKVPPPPGENVRSLLTVEQPPAAPPVLGDPLVRAGVALAGANTPREGLPESAEDGLLSALEVAGMHLEGTSLVVLSACQTGLGDPFTGEGVFGLRRSFILAGARAVVMSLWNVSDLSTALLMERFYGLLVDQQATIGDALRSASTYLRRVTIGELRRAWSAEEGIFESEEVRQALPKAVKAWETRPDADRPFADPRYWAAFICEGQAGEGILK